MKYGYNVNNTYGELPKCTKFISYKWKRELGGVRAGRLEERLAEIPPVMPVEL